MLLNMIFVLITIMCIIGSFYCNVMEIDKGLECKVYRKSDQLKDLMT